MTSPPERQRYIQQLENHSNAENQAQEGISRDQRLTLRSAGYQILTLREKQALSKDHSPKFSVYTHI